MDIQDYQDFKKELKQVYIESIPYWTEVIDTILPTIHNPMASGTFSNYSHSELVHALCLEVEYYLQRLLGNDKNIDNMEQLSILIGARITESLSIRRSNGMMPYRRYLNVRKMSRSMSELMVELLEDAYMMKL